MKSILFYDRLAMCNPPEDSGWTLLAQIDDATRNVVVYQKDGTVAVGFFETKGPPTFPPTADWKENFELERKFFLLKGTGRAIVGTRGFVEEYLSFRDQVLDQIIRANPTDLLISGRSQGGTHALYLYADALSLATPKMRVTGVGLATIGCVEPESRSVIRWLEDRSPGSSFHRVNLTGDPVPCLPLWLLGYVAHGRATTVGEGWRRLWPFDGSRHYNSTYLPYLEKSGLEF